MNAPVVLDRILVIDEAPVMAMGLHAVLSRDNASLVMEYRDNLLSALAPGRLENTRFDLVILGALPDETPEMLLELLADIKRKFDSPPIMIYDMNYHPHLPEQMASLGIDAYVHKFESTEVIWQAVNNMAAKKSYLSPLINTLYHDYKLNPDLVIVRDQVLISPVERHIIQLMCSGKSIKDIAANVQMPEMELQATLQMLLERMK